MATVEKITITFTTGEPLTSEDYDRIIDFLLQYGENIDINNEEEPK